jgi:hypothetical protein
MKIISLSAGIAGPACAIATSIKKYFYNDSKQTDMFDYLEISLLSIIQILLLNNDSDNNITNNLIHNNTFVPNINGCQTVTFNNFDRIISHHDLKEKYDAHDYIEFIEKYKRRYYRLIDCLKTENKIFFIRYGDECSSQFKEFIRIIQEINPLCEFYIINLIYDETNKEQNYDIPNLYTINFYYLLDKNVIYDDDLFYRTIQFNWKPVYDLILNHLNEDEKSLISFHL